jgi:hypothetical protein
MCRHAVALVEPGLFAFSRSLVAMLVLFPFAFRSLLKADRGVVLGRMFLGVFNSLNFLASSYALRDLNSATTAFVVTPN